MGAPQYANEILDTAAEGTFASDDRESLKSIQKRRIRGGKGHSLALLAPQRPVLLRSVTLRCAALHSTPLLPRKKVFTHLGKKFIDYTRWKQNIAL